jgi:UDP-3-O-[3-hydroxymyristoyl] glucosamine N-acyltransferase
MPLTVHEVAALARGEVRGDGSREIRGAATLEAAGPSDLAFAQSDAYLEKLATTAAGAVIVPRTAEAGAHATRAALVLADEPQLAFARALTRLCHEEPSPGVDARAFVAPSAEVDSTARVHALAVVGADARVGPRSVLHPHAVVGEGAVVGAACVLHPGAVLYPRCRLGDRVVVHANAVIGSDGYGYVWDGEGHFKIPQVGIAVLEDDVEVGAGCTIDRAALGETRIGRGTKVDNLVHVGHNVRVGKHCLLVAQVGIAGSTEIGNHVVLGGQVGVGGHLRIADGVRVGGQGGVAKSLLTPGDYWGTPAREHKTWLRTLGSLSRLTALWRSVRELTLRVESLERARRG